MKISQMVRIFLGVFLLVFLNHCATDYPLVQTQELDMQGKGSEEKDFAAGTEKTEQITEVKEVQKEEDKQTVETAGALPRESKPEESKKEDMSLMQPADPSASDVKEIPKSSEPQTVVQEKMPEVISSPKTPSPKVKLPKSPESGTKTSPIAKKPSKIIRTNALRGIDFKQIDHKSRIIVTLTKVPEYQANTIAENLIAVDIKNAYAPKRLLRSLDTSEFESAVRYIDVKQIKKGKVSEVRILISLKEKVPFETSRKGKYVLIDIEKPKTIEAKKPKKVETKPEPPSPTPPKEEAAAEAQAGLPQQIEKKEKEEIRIPEGTVSEKLYTGRKISLDFKDADIKNILRLIAEVSNLNVIAGDEVTGKITMRLVDVPWDQALDVILQARSLGMIRVGNVIRIAPIDKLKKEVEEELTAKRAKEKLEDLVTELIPVNYASAKELTTQVKSVLSERGDVKIDERTNILIVKDIPKNIIEARSLVKALDTKTPQVLIEARIVEANLTFQEELGVSWGFEASTGTDKKETGTLSGGITGNKVVDLPAQPKIGTAGILEFLFTSRHALKELDVALSAHENKGNIRIISSPKIATLDNKEASVEQGLRIPYRKLTTEGTVTVDFIEANLKLIVTPHVTNDGHIKMLIKVKKDAPDRTVVVEDVPSIDKKEAITEVLVKDAGMVVIAGVYSIEKSETVERIPLFHEIPLLGWLFKREAKENLRKDLMIFISPKILNDQI